MICQMHTRKNQNSMGILFFPQVCYISAGDGFACLKTYKWQHLKCAIPFELVVSIWDIFARKTFLLVGCVDHCWSQNFFFPIHVHRSTCGVLTDRFYYAGAGGSHSTKSVTNSIDGVFIIFARIGCHAVCLLTLFR